MVSVCETNFFKRTSYKLYMLEISQCIENPLVLTSGELVNRFKRGEFPDKTFSVLYARWFGLPAPSGLILEVRNRQVEGSYCIAPGIEDFLACHDLYLIRYDFRACFVELEKWMKEKSMRPEALLCRKEDVKKHIEESLRVGQMYAENFFVIVTERFPSYKHVMSTINGASTYIECSDDSDATHGHRDTRLCVLNEQKRLIDETGLSTDLIMQIQNATRRIDGIIGGNLICEFNIYNDTLYLSNAQRSSKKDSKLFPSLENEAKVVSPGVLDGTIKRLDGNPSSKIYTQIFETRNRHVFLAERPYSRFVDLLPFARGFIFNEGSMLCHLAILLREKEIPARIIQGSTERYKDGDSVFL